MASRFRAFVVLAQLLLALAVLPCPATQDKPAPQTIVERHEVRSLPGHFDDVPVLNSNSPEIVVKDGILVSTFSPSGMRVPEAHLNQTLSGRFDIFAHHIARPSDGLSTLYLGIVVKNPGEKTVTVNVLQAVSYLTKPDAPFKPLPSLADNYYANVFAGAGDRVMGEVLRGVKNKAWPDKVVVPPGQARMLATLAVPVASGVPPSNVRSLLARLESTGPLEAALVAKYAGSPPQLNQWLGILRNSGLAGPRDRPPTKPRSTVAVTYGRVSGISRGSTWKSHICDNLNGGFSLKIPEPGHAFSYVISTVEMGAWGTAQVQAAPLLVRYPDTAHAAHGNYGVEYNVVLPLKNASVERQTVEVSLNSPLKSNSSKNGLVFRQPPSNRVFFRGTVRVGFRDLYGVYRTRYVHLVQRQGERGLPLVTLDMAPSDSNLVTVDFLYPPDATPPQMLTVKTIGFSTDT